MKKKMLSIMLSIVMVVTLIPTVAFATYDHGNGTVPSEHKTDSAQNIAKHIDKFVDTNQVNEDISIENDQFVAEGNITDIVIPKTGEDGITIKNVDGEVQTKMMLPEEAQSEKGEMAKDGTVVYNPNDADFSVGVQALQSTDGENMWEAVRILLTIEKYSQEKEYKFKYDLPKGDRLIFAEEWAQKYLADSKSENHTLKESIVTGEVYVIDAQGNIIETIEPAWAYDANHKAIPTHYEIKGNELVQVVEFDKDTVFPIVADPTKHPNKTRYYHLTKTQARQVRDRYTGSTAAVVSKGIIALALGKANSLIPAIGSGWATISFLNDIYSSVKYNTWKEICDNFPDGKKYVKISATWKWHSGHRSYYPTGRMKATYTKTK